jgi:hypothetical protein
MSEISADDLFASLQEEFGKKKKERKAATPKAAVVHGRGEVNKTTGEVVDKLSGMSFPNVADWRMYQLMQEANHIAKGPDYGSTWIPEARVTWIARQHCFCCGSYADYIKGEYVRFRSQRAHATVLRRTETCVDIWHFGTDTPEEFVHHDEDVQRCPGCIKVEQKASEIWNAAVKKATEEQAELSLQIPGID